jgi:hypothetical protein
MSKEYKSIVVDAFHSDVTLDRRLKEMTDAGYTLVPVTFRGNVMIFERDDGMHPRSLAAHLKDSFIDQALVLAAQIPKQEIGEDE